MAKATSAIYFRMPQAQARMLKKAAKLERKTLNSFIRDAAVTIATQRIEQEPTLIQERLVNPTA